MLAEVLTKQAPLTSDDRCDRCGARAYLRATFRNGAELLFCAHHAKQYRDQLEQDAVVLQDETGQLAR